MTDETAFIAQLKNSHTQEKAFERLVREHQEPLYWHIRHMLGRHEDSNDVLQNTFIKAWSAINGFRGDCQLKTWLYRIATNETLTFIERNKNTVSLNQNEMIGMRLQGDPYFDGDRAQQLLQHAVSQLPPKQRQVFTMKYFQEMKYEEMSQTLNTSVGALKASYHHAVKKILAYFNKLN